jgi:hypothetical protein
VIPRLEGDGVRLVVCLACTARDEPAFAGCESIAGGRRATCCHAVSRLP